MSTDSAPPTPVEQNRIKRSGVGLRAYDPENACPGFTFFTSRSVGNPAFLIDLEGNVVHRWELPYAPASGGYLTDRGTLFFNGQIADDRYLGRRNYQAGAALEMDWNGKVLWEVHHPDHHHDGLLLRNGNVLLLCHCPIPSEIAKRVVGGRPGSDHDGEIYADYLLEMTKQGEPVWKWRAWEHMDPEDYPMPTVQDAREEWTHGNGIAEWPNGDILISFKNISTLATIERKTGAIVWRIGSPLLCGQHGPTPLPNGHVLIFDNGSHRLDESQPFSRVLEINPMSNAVVWKYQDNPTFNFFSPLVSNAQRLPNGNTLICEGVFGRFFEVTREGQIVWEYVNPYFAGPPNAQDNRVFRAFRYSDSHIDRARTAR